jgi:indole-3-glycerol phosphate synthase
MILDEIVAYKKIFNAQSQLKISLAKIRGQAEALPKSPCFLKALQLSKVGLIAEIKKASPSKGLIRPNFQVEEIANAYENSLASCVSCLTDEKFFQGSETIFKNARKVLKKPMLRKDFTIEPYNIYEAKVMQADAILLIASILDNQQMKEYYQIANNLGLDTLFEVHDEKELERVLSINPLLVGINNRNLQTFETSLDISVKLIPLIPKNVYIVSESAISNRQDIETLLEAGAHGFLIGEVFMRENDIQFKINEMFNNLKKKN